MEHCLRWRLWSTRNVLAGNDGLAFWDTERVASPTTPLETLVDPFPSGCCLGVFCFARSFGAMLTSELVVRRSAFPREGSVDTDWVCEEHGGPGAKLTHTDV